MAGDARVPAITVRSYIIPWNKIVHRAGFLKRAGPADFAGPPARRPGPQIVMICRPGPTLWAVSKGAVGRASRADSVGHFSRRCGPGVVPSYLGARR